MANNNPYLPGNSPYAIDTTQPYSDYLAATQPQQSGQQPSGWEKKTGQWAMFLDKFLEGAQRGTARKQQQELMKQRQQDVAINTYMKALDQADPVAAAPVRQQILTAMGLNAMSYLGKKGEDGGPGQHVLGALKNIGTGLLGGKVEKFKGYGDQMGNWATQIANMVPRAKAQERDIGQFNQLIQDRVGQIRKDTPGREIYQEDLLADPKIRTGAQMVASTYGADALSPALGAYPKDPSRGLLPSQKQEEKLKGEALSGLNGGAAPNAPPGGATGDNGVPQLVPSVNAPQAGGAAPQAQPSAAGGQVREAMQRKILTDLGVREKERVNVLNSKTGETSQAYMDPVNKELYGTDGKPLGPEYGRETVPKANKPYKRVTVMNLDTGKQMEATQDPETGDLYQKQGDKLIELGSDWGHVTTPKSKKETTAEGRREFHANMTELRGIRRDKRTGVKQAEAKFASEMDRINADATRIDPDTKKLMFTPETIANRRKNAAKVLEDEKKALGDIYDPDEQSLMEEMGVKPRKGTGPAASPKSAPPKASTAPPGGSVHGSNELPQ